MNIDRIQSIIQNTQNRICALDKELFNVEKLLEKAESKNNTISMQSMIIRLKEGLGKREFLCSKLDIANQALNDAVGGTAKKSDSIVANYLRDSKE